MNRGIGLCVLSLVSVLVGPVSASAQEQTAPMITTQGIASISVMPDQAWITLAGESRGAKPADAQKLNAAALESIRAELRKAGVSEEAIKTGGYSLEPQMQYDNGKSTVIGYVARHTLVVRVDDLNAVGAVIDAAGRSGATSISSIRYDVKDRDATERRALGLAVRDGMRRAEAIAAGAGKTVSTVWRIDDQRMSQSPQPIMYAKAASRGGAADMPTQISPDQLEIEARVAITVVIR